MGLRQTTPPAVEPISLADMKLHLRVDADDDDSLISALISAAREYAEVFTRRQIITATWMWTFDKFADELIVPRAPLQSVTSVKYIDTAGVQQTLSADVYDVHSADTPGRVTLAYAQSWPDARAQTNAIEIVFVAGYGDAAGSPRRIPDSLIAALKLLAGDFYEHREGRTEIRVQDNPTVDRLLSTFRILENHL